MEEILNCNILNEITCVYDIDTESVMYNPITIKTHCDLSTLKDLILVMYNGDKIGIEINGYKFIDDNIITIYPRYAKILDI